MSAAPTYDRDTFDLLVALLRSELGMSPPPASQVANADWERLEQTAEVHGLEAFLASLLAPWVEHVPAEMRERFELRAVGNRLRNRFIGLLSREIDAGLATAGAPGLMLKGAALLHRLYGEDGPRRLSDIDVLVRVDELERAHDALEEIGLVALPEREEHFFRRGMHVHLLTPQARSVAVELHWDLCEPYRPYALDLEAIWSASQPLGDDWQAMRTMSREHEIAYLCVHLERHALVYRHLLDRGDWLEVVARGGHGVRLLWLYDVALYLRRWGPAIDWDLVVDSCRRWSIGANVRTALEMCRRIFLVAPPAGVVERLTIAPPRFVETIACRALAADSGEGEVSRRTHRNATLALNVSGYLTPDVAYLRQRYGEALPLPLLRLRHLASAGATSTSAALAILRRVLLPDADRIGGTRGHMGAFGDCDRPLASPLLTAEPFANGLSVYDPERDATHRLNPAAARVLSLCDGVRTTTEIAAEILGQGGAPAALTEADVDAAILLLLEQGLASPGPATWPSPLNGQRKRLRMVAELLARFDCRAVIETGTFLGSTTEYFLRHTGGAVYSVEKNPQILEAARRRLAGETNVHLFLGDSRELLRRLGEDTSVPKRGVLFYLDAHDPTDAPLRDELAAIVERWSDSLILVDDFQVPFDGGYGFDRWSDGDQLSLDRIPALDDMGLVPFFPAAPSVEESGPRRGCVVLAPQSLAEMVASIPSLRPCRAARRIPPDRLDEYTMHGSVQVTYQYSDDTPAAKRPNAVRQAEVDRLLELIRQRSTFYYGDTDTFLYQALDRYPIAGKKVAVMGSIMPLYESACLVFGGLPTTIEHNVRESDDPRLTYLTTAEYDRSPILFDAALSISTFEHDGLGRYGDPLDPRADLEAMQKMKRMLVPGGRLYLAVPIGSDELVWNLHRVYGRLRLPLLLAGWRVVETFGFDDADLDRRWSREPQPLFVLENI